MDLAKEVSKQQAEGAAQVLQAAFNKMRERS